MTVRQMMAAVAGLAMCSLCVTGPVAQAVQPEVHDRVVSEDPAGATPHVLDGTVRSIAEVGSHGLAGGYFTSVRSASGGTPIAVTSLVAFELDTGDVLPGFHPEISGTVYDVISSGDGRTAYVAGDFSRVAGRTGTSRVARIDVETGALDSTFRSPGFDGIIKQLVLHDGRLYAGGNFTKAGTFARTALASLDPATGAVTSAVDLTFSGPRNGGALQVAKFDVTPDGQRMVAIGNFTSIDGLPRDQIAMIDLDTAAGGPARVADWQTTRYSDRCAVQFDTPMRDVDIDSTGTYFVVVTTGGYAGGAKAGVLCDTAARWEISARGPGVQPAWIDYTGGDTFWSVAVAGPAIYVGGHFRWLNNPFGNGVAGPGAVAREGIAALDPRNGLPLSWNPGRARGQGAYSLLATDRGLWVGSDTDRIGGEYHARVALMPLDGGTVPATITTGSLPGSVYSLGAGYTDVVGGRAMTDSTTSRAWRVPSSLGWRSIRGAFMAGGTVYYGTSNGRLNARSFDGTTFGGVRPVDLAGLTAFSTDLKTTTGMFFEPATARLYYSMAGSSVLHYRYFSPQTKTIGSLRYTGPASMQNLNFAAVASMFRAGTYLFVVSAKDGALRRFNWNATASAPVAGSDLAVGGPRVDRRDWRARGAFVLSP